MMDGIIKADGTSRLMRANLPATYEEFRAQCAAGTQPLDVLFNAIGWSQLPTFLNKANLTQDDVAALFGKDSGAVPNDLFAWLGQYAQHWWSVLHGQAGTGYEEKRTAISADVRISDYYNATTISYSKKITIDQASGVVSLMNPQSMDMSVPDRVSAEERCASLDSLLPVYITGLHGDPTGIYYLPANSVGGAIGYTYHGKTFGYWRSDSHYYLDLAGEYANVFAQKVSGQIYNISAGETTFVYSTDRNAYPDSGTVDSLTYTYLGIPFQNAVTAPKIATGSYTGTGTYGASNPNSLTFDFAPKLLLVKMRRSAAFYADNGTYNNCLLWMPGVTSCTIYGTSAKSNDIVVNGNTISWYNNFSAVESQLNTSGQTYDYVAIG